MGLWQSGKLFCGQTNQNLKFFLENWDAMSSGLRGQGHPSCYHSAQSEACISDGMGLHECVWHGSLHIWKGTINAEKYYPSSRTTYAPIQTLSSFREDLAFSNMTMPIHILQSITTSWLRRRRIRVLKWPACSPDLSAIENICTS